MFPKERTVILKRLHVGNVLPDATEHNLRELFSRVGDVTSITVIYDRYTSRSRGFAFVEMATGEAAQEAIQQLNDHELLGRRIRVEEARQWREKRDHRDDGWTSP
ncbi:MAG TPA: RNA-binding protein [Anaerolineae bacterium]|nr:RNA-binding protein [Anaerolineae bacterium]